MLLSALLQALIFSYLHDSTESIKHIALCMLYLNIHQLCAIPTVRNKNKKLRKTDYYLSIYAVVRFQCYETNKMMLVCLMQRIVQCHISAIMKVLSNEECRHLVLVNKLLFECLSKENALQFGKLTDSQMVNSIWIRNGIPHEIHAMYS